MVGKTNHDIKKVETKQALVYHKVQCTNFNTNLNEKILIVPEAVKT